MFLVVLIKHATGKWKHKMAKKKLQIAAFVSRSSSSSSGHLLLVVSFSVGQVSLSDLGDCFLKQLLIFYSLTIPSPDEEREIDLGTFVDKEEGDIDYESDVELDLDLDLHSGHNDNDLESDTEIVYSPIQWIELAVQRNFNSP